VSGQDLILYEFVEICIVNLKLSDHKLIAEICYCGKLYEFATAANPNPKKHANNTYIHNKIPI
jgi:hypothetical protein